MGSVVKLVKLTKDSGKWFFIYLSPGMKCGYAAFGSIVLRGPPAAMPAGCVVASSSCLPQEPEEGACKANWSKCYPYGFTVVFCFAFLL